MQSELNMIVSFPVALRSCTHLPVLVAKLKLPAMMGNEVGQSPQFVSLMVSKVSGWLEQHSNFWKPVQLPRMTQSMTSWMNESRDVHL